MRSIRHLIGGVPVGGSTAAPVHDPATGQQTAEVVLGRRAEADAAVGAAEAPGVAFPTAR
ncbi:hypothetical protein [Actinomadura chokoriensis]|uniref:Aldehyde dehydrogenase family protein n=1 Tax=Actinomadura chokoriensis TaxID=454156 RepID=A0ABV4QP91_9ACTN